MSDMELVHEKCGCGEFPVTKHEHDNWITECRCGMNTGWHDGQADAREAWNRALRRHLQGCTMNKPNWTGGCSCGQVADMTERRDEWKAAYEKWRAMYEASESVLRELIEALPDHIPGKEEGPLLVKARVLLHSIR